MVALSEARCPDYPRFVYSALLLIFSCVVTFYAIVAAVDGGVRWYLILFSGASFCTTVRTGCYPNSVCVSPNFSYNFEVRITNDTS